MTNQTGEKPDRDSMSIEPDRLNEVAVIEPPIWEEIADYADDDLDPEPDLAAEMGLESMGGAVTTPDWNDVEDLAAAVGVTTAEREIVHTNEILEDRDRDRWELDPQSAEDFER